MFIGSSDCSQYMRLTLLVMMMTPVLQRKQEERVLFKKLTIQNMGQRRGEKRSKYQETGENRERILFIYSIYAPPFSPVKAKATYIILFFSILFLQQPPKLV